MSDIWVLDDQGRAVTGLMWETSDGTPIRVRPFAWNKNRRPDGERPTQTATERYPSASVGGTPECAGRPPTAND